ncbi:BLUF domain-containing protein [Mesobaculum littorinae]|nr:BLUF domain-containing protein [Mesobaculum littorinae]
MPRRSVCFSTATPTQSSNDIDRLLGVSRRNNARDGITGLPTYRDHGFFQVLEGPDADVDLCLTRIETDPTHGDIQQLFDDTVGDRGRPGWKMWHARPATPALRRHRQVVALADPRCGGEIPGGPLIRPVIDGVSRSLRIGEARA